MLVLKHLYDWSFDECEREVRGSLVYRAFCRIDCERVLDAKTLIRLAGLIDPAVLKGLVERLVQLARQQRIVRGRRLRVDTTVVETNIHYPTDSTLLADGVRVLTRTLQRLHARVTTAGGHVRDRTRSVARRVFELAQRSRRVTGRSKPAVRARSHARMTQLYRELMHITRAVVRDADAVGAAVDRRPQAALTGMRESTCARPSASCSASSRRRARACSRATRITPAKSSVYSSRTRRPSARAKRPSRRSSAKS